MLFTKGKLYVRLMDEKPTELFYPDADVPENYQRFSVQNIASMRWGAAEPSFGWHTELSRNGERTDAGYLIEFEEADNDRIRFFLSHWGERWSVCGWAQDVSMLTGLQDEDKERVKRVAAEFQA